MELHLPHLRALIELYVVEFFLSRDTFLQELFNDQVRYFLESLVVRVLHYVDVHDSALLWLANLHRLQAFKGELNWSGVSATDCAEYVHLNVAFEPLQHSLGRV